MSFILSFVAKLVKNTVMISQDDYRMEPTLQPIMRKDMQAKMGSGKTGNRIIYFTWQAHGESKYQLSVHLYVVFRPINKSRTSPVCNIATYITYPIVRNV